MKNKIEEIAQSHTNANLYNLAKETLEKIMRPDDQEKLNEVIKWLEEQRNFEVNMNFDPWITELLTNKKHVKSIAEWVRCKGSPVVAEHVEESAKYIEALQSQLLVSQERVRVLEEWLQKARAELQDAQSYINAVNNHGCRKKAESIEKFLQESLKA